MDLLLPTNSFYGRKSLSLKMVVTWQNGCWLAAGPSATAHKHCTECQQARSGATDVSEINKKREMFLKAYYWEITMLNSNFLVGRLCGSAHALPHEFVFWPSESARMGKLIPMRCHVTVAPRVEMLQDPRWYGVHLGRTGDGARPPGFRGCSPA